MIWYLIGYFVMAFISGPLMTFYCMWIAKRRGYNASDFIGFMFFQGPVKVADKYDAKTGCIVLNALYIFNAVFWPITILRMVFKDIPEAIEHYEDHYFKGEES